MTSFAGIKTDYAPILAVRPAEMAALEELPEKDKDQLLPIILLRPWVASQTFDKTMERVSNAFGERKWIADIDNDYTRNTSAEARPVHTQLDQLKNPSNGYENWCEFIKATPSLVPSIQILDPSQIASQTARLDKLGRGIVVRLQKAAFIDAGKVAEIVVKNCNQEILFVLDYGQITQELLSALQTSPAIKAILGTRNDIKIALSGSSFPMDFKKITKGEIIERRHFNEIKALNPTADLVYSDRGSARAIAMDGGGVPTPRIDYPLSQIWHFYRDEDGYRKAAKTLIATKGEVWIEGLEIWGTQLIRRTAKGDEYAIDSPAKSTAARINIHMHQQIFYGKPLKDLLDTDDEWKD